jgi:hypothetical protein
MAFNPPLVTDVISKQKIISLVQYSASETCYVKCLNQMLSAK